ncbi:MAG: alpha/beta hydrolase [Rhodospirillales bacterium]|nr:MAG: alpha/beta hydrolase [Rhodospirillales bacterium]
MTAGTILIVPGLGSSGPDHWQTAWEAALPNCQRVHQSDWDNPDLDAWMQSLEEAVVEAAAPVVLVAHSLACALVAHWAAATKLAGKVHGALLVAPADVEDGERAPLEVRGFAPMPLEVLPFKCLVVASHDDPYVDPGRAHFFASCWYAGFVDAGSLGHINADSALGDWPEGREFLAEILPP